MKIRKSLAGFACGVVCTALFAFVHSQGQRMAFELQAWEHGAGYFELNIRDSRCVWHWYEKH